MENYTLIQMIKTETTKCFNEVYKMVLSGYEKDKVCTAGKQWVSGMEETMKT